MITNSPAVSIIIPVYNASSTLVHCMKSLSLQTYSHLELLFVDDCSTDNSLDEIVRYSNICSTPEHCVRILRHERNRGVAAARNTGLANATGEYIYYVDADDSIEPDTIRQLVSESRKKDLDILGHEWYLTFRSNERYMRQPTYATPAEALRKMMCGVMRWNLWLFLVKRSLYVDNQIKFTEGMNMGEDMMVMMKLFMRAKNVSIIHSPFYHYRQTNEQSLTKIYSQEHIRQVTHNVSEVENAVHGSSCAASLSGLLPFLKLNIKLPLLVTDDTARYRQWLEWFPEANGYVMDNRLLPFRTRVLQWMAARRCFFALRFYYRVVFKLVYGVIYR